MQSDHDAVENWEAMCPGHAIILPVTNQAPAGLGHLICLKEQPALGSLTCSHSKVTLCSESNCSQRFLLGVLKNLNWGREA